MKTILIIFAALSIHAGAYAQTEMEINSAAKLELSTFDNIAHIQSVAGDNLTWRLTNAGANLKIVYPKVEGTLREIVLVMKDGQKVFYKEVELTESTLLWCMVFYSSKPLLFEKEENPFLKN